MFCPENCSMFDTSLDIFLAFALHRLAMNKACNLDLCSKQLGLEALQNKKFRKT